RAGESVDSVLALAAIHGITLADRARPAWVTRPALTLPPARPSRPRPPHGGRGRLLSPVARARE
ncbi:hypothetical protein ACGF07_32850, partial [Kitasatospora sp. NPDC048194]|uniref:hypothetical protein n=1 Tax=Kitasatospora sp. NPDC048194 TaxID=3364045 RepID=UPI00371BABA9